MNNQTKFVAVLIFLFVHLIQPKESKKACLMIDAMFFQEPDIVYLFRDDFFATFNLSMNTSETKKKPIMKRWPLVADDIPLDAAGVVHGGDNKSAIYFVYNDRYRVYEWMTSYDKIQKPYKFHFLRLNFVRQPQNIKIKLVTSMDGSVLFGVCYLQKMYACWIQTKYYHSSFIKDGSESLYSCDDLVKCGNCTLLSNMFSGLEIGCVASARQSLEANSDFLFVEKDQLIRAKFDQNKFTIVDINQTWVFSSMIVTPRELRAQKGQLAQAFLLCFIFLSWSLASSQL
ncbi:hypothetical protein B4U79_18938 [Dinothrombium tinctorium]|uniref:Uncharacterized protein n=1 Tax=Dinothrombium tinctorium TaxID=1965070 RepID=A0A443RM97_9ACAR|nr:hypothetical protein B4U79_18938 [Dinothrombium tinctorium]